MRTLQLFTCLGLMLLWLLVAGEGHALPAEAENKLILEDDPKAKYKYHEANSLSGIELQPNFAAGTFKLSFDQQLTEAGILEIKNASGQVIYTGVLTPTKEHATSTMDIGKLSPGVYAIEVKSGGTTFWKKLRIRK